MRAILDVNILLSALLVPLGFPSKILGAWIRKRFTLVACDKLLSELRDVVSRPFFRSRLRPDVAEVLLISIRDLSLYCEGVPTGPIAPDHKYSYLLALAEAAQAEFLVTGDKKLLAMGSHKNTTIVSPREFSTILGLDE